MSDNTPPAGPYGDLGGQDGIAEVDALARRIASCLDQHLPEYGFEPYRYPSGENKSIEYLEAGHILVVESWTSSFHVRVDRNDPRPRKENERLPPGHLPVLAKGRDGWRRYCWECSFDADDYVETCDRWPYVPPVELVDAAALAAAREETADVQRRLARAVTEREAARDELRSMCQESPDQFTARLRLSRDTSASMLTGCEQALTAMNATLTEREAALAQAEAKLAAVTALCDACDRNMEFGPSTDDVRVAITGETTT